MAVTLGEPVAGPTGPTVGAGSSTSLRVQGVFTTAGAFTLVAFVGILAGSRPKSEMPRLAGVLVGLVTGAVAGGLLFLHARSDAPALQLVITVLVVLTAELRRRTCRRTR